MANPFVYDGVAAKLIASIKEYTEKNGGDGKVLRDLLDGNDAIYRNMAGLDVYTRNLVVKMTDDTDFRNHFLSTLEPNDSTYLKNFFDVVDYWRELRNTSFQIARSNLIGPPVEEINKGIPYRVNDAMSAYSVIQIDTLSEDLLVKSAIRVVAPDKKIGDNDVIVVASPMSSFLFTIGLLNRSLVKIDSERQVLKTPLSDKNKEAIYDGLDFIERQLLLLKKQIEETLGGRK